LSQVDPSDKGSMLQAQLDEQLALGAEGHDVDRALPATP